MTNLAHVVSTPSQSKPFRIEFVESRKMDIFPYQRDCVEVNFINRDENGQHNWENYRKGFKIIEKPMHYSMSFVDENSKCSQGYYDCIGLLVSGYSEKSQNYLSFLSHQCPQSFINANDGCGFPLMHEFHSFKEFQNNLIQNLKKMNQYCAEETISALIFAGTLPPDWEAARKIYSRVVDEIITEIFNGVGIIPHIIKPKKHEHLRAGIGAYFYSQENTIFLTNSNKELLTKKEDIESFLNKI